MNSRFSSKTAMDNTSKQSAQALPEAWTDDEQEAFRRYCEEGKARAMTLGNRGPIRYGEDGKVCREIVEAYQATGFYVLEDVLSAEELHDLQTDFEALMENAPFPDKKSKTDKHGRPVQHPDIYTWNKPLSDPMGGTPFGVFNFKGGETKGRHHIKMKELPPPPGAPKLVPQNIFHPLAYMDSALRLYGHPGLLAVTEAINGPDFTPFTETMWHKPAFTGIATAWHQDPSNAWDDEWSQPGFDVDKCGFSFHASLYNCTAENGLWVLPGTNHHGRADIKALAAASGSDRLEGAVPIICKPGDVYIQSRTALHGAFPNSSPEKRCTVQFGFNKRSTVLGLETAAYDHLGKSMKVYDNDYIHERARMIQLGIDARKQKYPNEKSYVYQPYVGREEEARWSPKMKENQYGQYWMKDIVV